RGLEASRPRAGHGLLDDARQVWRDVAVDLPARPGRGVADRKDEVDLVVGLEGRLPRAQLVEHAAGAEDVAAPVELPPEGLLGRHVLHLALDDAGLRLDPVVR